MKKIINWLWTWFQVITGRQIENINEESPITKITREEIEELTDSEFIRTIAKARQEYVTGKIVAIEEVMKMLRERM